MICKEINNNFIIASRAYFLHLELLIQQSVEGEFRQHDSMVTVMVKWSGQSFA